MHDASGPAASGPPSVGIWGTFDAENYGDALIARIARHELHRRLPDAPIRTFSLFGHEHGSSFEAAAPSEPLGTWSERRAAELADELACVIIGGGDIIHTQFDVLADCYEVEGPLLTKMAPDRFFIDALGPELEKQTPTIWNAVGVPMDVDANDQARVKRALADRAYVAVRDEPSRRRLIAAGVDREVAVVPDPGILVGAALPPADLDERLRWLRAIGAYPREGRALIVQANATLIPHVSGIAAQLQQLGREDPGVRIVLATTGPCHGDENAAAALAYHLDEVYRMPTEVSLEDLVAAIRGAAGVVASSYHVVLTALAFQVPAVALHLNRFSKVEALAEVAGNEDGILRHPGDLRAALIRARTRGSVDLSPTRRRLTQHFDRLAEIARGALLARTAGSVAAPHDEAARLRRRLHIIDQALTARERRAIHRSHRAAVDHDRERKNRRQLEDRVRALEVELALIRGSRTFRYTRWIRSLRARLVRR